MTAATTTPKESRTSFASVNPNNLGTVRKLNSVLFPIKYSERFYQDVQKPDVEDFCKLVYYNDIPVGTICCRLEEKDGKEQLYLMTMGILAPYRSRGLGAQTLDNVLKAAKAHTKRTISSIYLHVQVSNTEAKAFYERHGFKEVGLAENYYKRIEPHDAWILAHDLLD